MTAGPTAGMITLIPAKSFAASKTRLSPVLSPTQRIELSRTLLLRTIGLAGQLGPVLVVSPCRAVRRLARQAGAQTLAEQQPGLNAAIRHGIGWAQANGAAEVLILPLDLPRLTLADLAALLALGRQTGPGLGQTRPGLVIAPCQRGQGTNALFLTPPTLIAPHFGPDSFAAHVAAAYAIGFTPHIYRSPGLAFDLDLPQDWAQIEKSPDRPGF